MTDRIRVGFLHIGPADHGVVRYGRVLAAAVGQFADIREQHVELTGTLRRDRALLRAAAEAFAGVSIVHIQYEKGAIPLWGPRWRQLFNLATWFRYCRPVAVVTIHDVYPPAVPWRGVAYRLALRMLESRCRLLVVAFGEEARRLLPMLAKPERVRVIGHFVDERSPTCSRASARGALGIVGKRVVTILGRIHAGQRKGHRMAVDALPSLPPDVLLVFAGGNGRGSPGVSDALKRRAAELGVTDRLRITGYLSEDEIDLYLMATDLALCPFRELSASSTMALWLSVGRPILASDLPQVAEYRAWQPDAMATFAPYTADVLAAAIERELALIDSRRGDQPSRIKDRFGIRRIAAEHVDAYREIATQLA